MAISGGGRKRFKGLYGAPGKYAPGTIEANTDSYDSRGRKVLAGTSDMSSLAGMPDTGRLNGGWGRNHSGRLENRSGHSFTSGEENAERTKANWRTKEERRAERGLRGLLEDKRRRRLKDPHEDDDVGKVRLKKGGSLDFVDAQLKRDGSLAVATDGLCLKGEDQGSRTTMSESGKYVYSEQENAKKWRSIEEVAQDVREIIGGGGMFSWDAKTRTMGPGGAMVGRSWVAATGTGRKGDGTYYLTVTFTQGGATAAATHGGSKSDTVCHIPIYTVSGGRVTEDLRGAFVVPCWE